MINRDIFYAQVRKSPFNGRLTASQKQGLDSLLDVWEQSFYKQTSIPQFAYELGTTHHETGATMQPIKETGGPKYYFKMYDIKGSRPYKAKELGNIYPGDGAKFPGMGYVQNTGRANARKATKRLRELKIIDNTVDFEKNPELQMVPRYAAAIMFIGMEEGWFTGRKLDQIIDDKVDGDEHQDFIKGRSIINGKDKAVIIADHSDDYLTALVAAIDNDRIPDDVKELAVTKGISIETPEVNDVDTDSFISPVGKKVRGKFEEDTLTAPQIRYVQTRLRNLGFLMVGKVDGVYGTSTKAGVAALQNTVGIEADGHYGPATREALARTDGSNEFVVPDARKNTTVKDLRVQGSRTIKAADATQTTAVVAGGGLGLMGFSSAAFEYVPQAISFLSPVRDFFSDVPMWVWALVGFIFIVVITRQATKVKEIRVDDERTGAHNGLPTSSEPPVTVISSKSTYAEGDLPSFLKPEQELGEQETDVVVTR